MPSSKNHTNSLPLLQHEGLLRCVEHYNHVTLHFTLGSLTCLETTMTEMRIILFPIQFLLNALLGHGFNLTVSV